MVRPYENRTVNMAFELDHFEDSGLDGEFLEWLVDVHSANIYRHFSRLWDYYTIPAVDMAGGSAVERKIAESSRCTVQAQEYGLPSRITGLVRSSQGDLWDAAPAREIQRKEVVIENDIAWRVNAAADFLFGKPITITSKAPDGQKRKEIESIIKAVFAANGGLGFFQDMAVLGSVYGFVDCLIRAGFGDQGPGFSSPTPEPRPLDFAKAIALELIEAPRALPILDEDDYRIITHYVQHFHQRKNAVTSTGSFLSRLLRTSGQAGDARRLVEITEIMSDKHWQRYEDKQLVAEGPTPWGFLPVVHIQNVAQPYYYEGVSDVEPLIPLQDELNTRLSDRASRITFQSFKMYLGKGIDGFENKPVAPGRMWCTDNPDAAIEEFGGDASTPSESQHIAEIREAMDKISGVTPVVAGLLNDRVGNLTSAVALRLTFMGMLSKNERKRHTYSAGLARICRMVLSILDTANVYKTDESEREVDIFFPSPLPENTMEKLQEAQIKRELGVPAEQVLRELGYETNESQV
jgi:hypothetical protein